MKFKTFDCQSEGSKCVCSVSDNFTLSHSDIESFLFHLENLTLDIVISKLLPFTDVFAVCLIAAV